MKYWSPQSGRQQFWGSMVVLAFGVLIALASAACGWQAYLHTQLRSVGESTSARLISSAPAGEGRYHLQYAYEAGERPWTGETWTSRSSGPDWDEIQRTQRLTVRYFLDDPSTSAWDASLNSKVLESTVLSSVLGVLSAFLFLMSFLGLRRSRGW